MLFDPFRVSICSQTSSFHLALPGALVEATVSSTLAKNLVCLFCKLDSAKVAVFVQER